MAGHLRIGPAGWSYPDWHGPFYPPKPARGFKPLPFIARWFDVVEINSTFYRPAVAKTAEGWVRAVADRPDFRFTAKLGERFTHDREKPWTAEEARAFREGLVPLREAGRLSALLAQFPWSFRDSPENRRRLEAIAADFADLAPIVVEVRHASWDSGDARAFFRTHALAWCNIDQPPLRDCIGPAAHATAPLAYVRFHGRNSADWFRKDAGRDARYDYCYSAAELAPWVERIRRLVEESLEVVVITNNHFRGQAAANALQLGAALRGPKVSIPESLVRSYPALSPIALPEGPAPGELF